MQDRDRTYIDITYPSDITVLVVWDFININFHYCVLMLFIFATEVHTCFSSLFVTRACFKAYSRLYYVMLYYILLCDVMLFTS